MTKRLLCFVICALMICTGTALSAEGTTDTPADEALETALAYMQGIGMEEEFANEETITRGHFTALVLKILNESVYESETYAVFSDVDETTDYADEIYMAYDRKIINGSGGAFRPDDDITTMEAVKITLDALGYRAFAMSSGGYPSGYINIANSNNLLKNIKSAAGAAISGRDTAVLLKNALTAEIMTAAAYGDTVKYDTEKGRDMLKEYFKLEKVEGIVTAVTYASLTDPGFEKTNGSIAINGVTYKYYEDCGALLGYNVLAFADTGGEETVKFVIPYKNDEITLSGDALWKFENNKFYEEKEQGGEKYSVDSSFSFIYNGKAYLDYTADDMIPDSGYVKLIDNNRDGEYDVVSVTCYEFMEVTSIDQIGGVLYGKSKVFENGIDTGIYGGYFKFYEDGRKGVNEISFADIKIGSVLACAVSKDETAGEIYDCQRSASGKVEGVADNDKVVVGAAEYKATKYFTENYSELLGNNGKFVLSPDGKLVTFSVSSDVNYQYGYIIEAGKTDGISTTYQIKMYTQEDKAVIYNVASKYSIDGKTASEGGVNSIQNKLINTDGKTKRQLVKYLLNEDGEISSIDTADTAAEIAEEKLEKGNTLLCYNDKMKSRVKSGSGIFKNFVLSSGAAVFVVPGETEENVSDDDFMYTGRSYFENDAEYTVSTYDMGSNGYFSALVVYSSASGKGLTENSSGGVVEKVVNAIPDENFDNAANKKIYFWNNGSYLSYFVSENVNLVKNTETGAVLGAGDIIRYEIKNGIIDKLSIDFDAQTMEFTSVGSGFVYGDNGYNRQLSYGLSSIYRKFGTYCYVSSVKKADGTYDYSVGNLKGIELGGAKFVQVNRKTGYVKSIYASDIYDYFGAKENASQIVTRSRYWSCSMAVVYVEGEE